MYEKKECNRIRKLARLCLKCCIYNICHNIIILSINIERGTHLQKFLKCNIPNLCRKITLPYLFSFYSYFVFRIFVGVRKIYFLVIVERL